MRRDRATGFEWSRMLRRNIYLAGFMGTGKSTVGRELARVMGRKFIDLDLELEKRVGMPIPRIFEEHGEAWFRAQEKALALEVAGLSNRIVATGGGTLMDPEVFSAFGTSGLLICLYTRRDDLIKRLERSDKRPLLTGGNVAEKVDALMQARKELYETIKIRVDTTELTPMEAARKIGDLLNTRQRILDRLQSQYIDLS